MTTMQRIDPKLITDRLGAGTLVRGEWGDGHERACLLAAIYPPCAEAKNPTVCPATLMPQWMAQLTLLIDDAPSDEHHKEIIRRYAKLAGMWWVLDEAAWGRLYDECCRLSMGGTAPSRLLLPAASILWAIRMRKSAEPVINAVLDEIQQEITDAE